MFCINTDVLIIASLMYTSVAEIALVECVRLIHLHESVQIVCLYESIHHLQSINLCIIFSSLKKENAVNISVHL